MPPKSMKNRAKIYRNSKLEAKSNRKVILEALETDFGPQDSDFGVQEGDFGAKTPQSYFTWGLLGEVSGMAEAYSEARIERVWPWRL